MLFRHFFFNYFYYIRNILYCLYSSIFSPGTKYAYWVSPCSTCNCKVYLHSLRSPCILEYSGLDGLQTTEISHSSGAWEIQDQWACRLSAWWEPTSWFKDGCLFSVLTWWKGRHFFLLLLFSFLFIFLHLEQILFSDNSFFSEHIWCFLTCVYPPNVFPPLGVPSCLFQSS